MVIGIEEIDCDLLHFGNDVFFETDLSGELEIQVALELSVR